MTRTSFTIATRGSDLALWQARHVRQRMLDVRPDITVAIEVIKTEGDRIKDVPLAQFGGKGLFVKDIESALVAGRADFAVHSMKDVPGDLAPGLAMAAISARADPRDALISRTGVGLSEMPAGARFGTSSLRRQCQVRALCPKVAVATLRGNVPTRLARLERGDFDAILLAASGLDRLGLGDRITARLDPAAFLPAVGQGALGIEVRADDGDATALAHAAINDPDGARDVGAERAFLSMLDGGCQSPIAAFARLDGDALVITGLVGRPDGTGVIRGEVRGDPNGGIALGKALATDLLARGAGDILAELRAAS